MTTWPYECLQRSYGHMEKPKIENGNRNQAWNAIYTVFTLHSEYWGIVYHNYALKALVEAGANTGYLAVVKRAVDGKAKLFEFYVWCNLT